MPKVYSPDIIDLYNSAGWGVSVVMRERYNDGDGGEVVLVVVQWWVGRGGRIGGGAAAA